jgi:hypothetical protein
MPAVQEEAEAQARSLVARINGGVSTEADIAQLRGAIAELQGARQAIHASALVAAPPMGNTAFAQGHPQETESVPSVPTTHASAEGSAHPMAGTGSPMQARLPEDFGHAVSLASGGAGSYGRSAGSQNVETLLERIARAVEALGSSGRGRGAYGPRPSEVTGQVAGMLATKPLGEDRLYESAN